MLSTTSRKPAKASLPTSQSLHDTLASANDAAQLARFTRNTGCAAQEVTDANGRLSILQVFEAMRRRGYHITEPVRPQQQPRAGFTAWCVSVTLPKGISFKLAYHTPGTVK